MSPLYKKSPHLPPIDMGTSLLPIAPTCMRVGWLYVVRVYACVRACACVYVRARAYAYLSVCVCFYFTGIRRDE